LAPNTSDEFEELLERGLAGLSRNARYLIGVSGGCDSVTLLRSLHERGYRKLIVCHLDHGFRARASSTDARFVDRLAKRLETPCITQRADVGLRARRENLSLETAGRLERHRFFAECSRKTGTSGVLLAHHADDQAETILYNFFRGSGAAGLAGMSTRSEIRVGRKHLELIRPMLGIPKQAIQDYASARKWSWREDASNASPEFTRNRIRHKLIPAIEETVERPVTRTILRHAEIARREQEYLEEIVTGLGLPAELEVTALTELHPAIQRRWILAWLSFHGIPDAGFREVEAVLSLLDPSHEPSKINLPGKRHARRRAGKIFLQ